LHAPAAHTGVAPARVGHVTPQPPQLAGSLDVSAHAPPHCVCPAGQLTTQRPAVHTSPEAHARPQPPQCARSVCVSRHEPEQSVSPAPHEVTQRPAEHT
jgi:hypothetical protein